MSKKAGPSSLLLGRRFAASLFASLALCSVAAANQQVQEINLGPAANASVLVPISQPNPEPDWNCTDAAIAGTTLRAITPNDSKGNQERIRLTLRVTKELALDSLFLTTGPIGEAFESGEIYGVEYDLFAHDDGTKPDWQLAECLPLLGRLMGLDENGDYGEIGLMYCFNESQYGFRRLVLGEPDQSKLWLGPMMHADGGGKSLVLSGINNDIYGDLNSGGTLKLGGAGNVIRDDAFYSTSLELHGGPIIEGTLTQQAPRTLRESPQSADAYQQLAVASGTSFIGDVTLIDDGAGGLVVEGTTPLQSVEGQVVHATGAITVEGSGITANVTLVADTTVYLACAESTLKPAVDDVLVVSTSNQTGEGVYLTGSSNDLVGSFFVPYMTFRLFGSDNDITGAVAAKKMKVLGGGNRLDDGTRPAI